VLDLKQSRFRRDSFNDVAELYARVRPGYPQALIDDLVAQCGLGPQSRVLEIGCGPGLMTVPVAETGARILALELGADLAAVARRELARFANVEIVQNDFDRWTAPPPAFDLVLIATAFHWLDPATRLARCAAALRAGGMLAIVETHWGVGATRSSFSREAQACWARWDTAAGKQPFVPPTLDTLPRRDDELDRCAEFDASEVLRYCVERSYTSAEYRDFITTWSSVQTLEPAARAGLLDCICALIDSRFAGRLRLSDAYSLWLARRR
jgi:protein-L-isoaspartate O-methyltransferase